MEDFKIIEEQILAGGIWGLLTAIGVAGFLTLFGTLLARPIKHAVLKYVQNSAATWHYLYGVVDSSRWWFFFAWLLNLGAHSLKLQANYLAFLKIIFVVATTAQVAIWAIRTIREWRDIQMKTLVSRDPSASAPIGLLSSVAEAMVVILLVMLALSNLGVDIGALIAGLGIGGVAVALAAQNILGDLFASFSIIFDKPFAIGDSIQVGNDAGTVENIGLKTTRVKSSSGEQLIFSNKDLLESRIRNYRRMRERRVLLKLRFGFDTPLEKIKMIPQIVQEAFEGQNKVRFDYCRFTEITDYAYSFEVVFWVLDPAFSLYLEIQESFYIKTLAQLQSYGIGLAEPARRIAYIQQNKETSP